MGKENGTAGEFSWLLLMKLNLQNRQVTEFTDMHTNIGQKHSAHARVDLEKMFTFPLCN
jgi:hypothetical protein